MQLFKTLRQLFGKPVRPTAHRIAPPAAEEAEVIVPQLSVSDLLETADQARDLFLLDVREPYEWRQLHIPAAPGRQVLHLPMNQVPDALAQLPRARPIIVLCAHGNRSYGVSHFLIEQGFDAHNLTGGIAAWHRQGGEVVQGR